MAQPNGLDAVTTEAIATAAGISTRTFFNYFPNKEVAALGMPPVFSAENKTALCAGRNAVSMDLKVFLDQHMASLAEQIETLCIVRVVVRTSVKASSVLERIRLAEQEELVACLRTRCSDEQTAVALASNAVASTSRAI